MTHREAVIQARMSSRRFPGKMLADMGGRPLLDRVLDRVGRVTGLDGCVVATSTDSSDDVIAKHCVHRGIPCERGPLEDVAGRFLEIAQRRRLTSFIRVNGDSPFLDHRLIEKGIQIFDQSRADLVSNIFPRSYPKGQSVEIIDTQAFCRAYRRMETFLQREHVTRYFYDHPDDFKIVSFGAGVDYSSLSFCIDTEEDLETARRLWSMGPHVWTSHWEDMVGVLKNLSVQGTR